MIPFAVLVNSIRDLLPGAEIDVDDSLSLAEAALEEDDPVLERARLATRGFVHGRHRRWVVADQGQVLSMTVHEFGSQEQAVLSVADLRERLRAAAVTGLRSTAWSVDAQYTDEDDSAMACVSRTTGPFQVIVAARMPAPSYALEPTTSQTHLPSALEIAKAVANRQLEQFVGH
jgi:hypothetical protein